MKMIQVDLNQGALVVILAVLPQEMAELVADDEDFYAYFEASNQKRYYVAISPTIGRSAKGPPSRTNLKIDEAVNVRLTKQSYKDLDRGYFVSFEIVPPNRISLVIFLDPHDLPEKQLEEELERRIRAN